MSNSDNKMIGKFSWQELCTQDVEGSKDFYGKLLGWEVMSMDMGVGREYHMFMKGKDPVAGFLKPPKNEKGEDVPNVWTNYISVEDLDSTVEKASELGANVCVPATDIPGKGRFAGIFDPQGAYIAFWEEASE